MAGQFFNKKPTDLDLNGPILSITTEPTGATGIGTTIGATGGASISMSGIATAVVGGGGSGGSGYLSYQWYEEGVGALSNGTYITGTASTGGFGSTTTLTLSNLITPTDNNRKFYFTADYVPSYTVGVQSSIVPGYTTGNAWNEPITSGVATVTVTPLIEIIAQPTNKQTLTNSTTNQHLTESTADITVNADLTDSAFSDDLTYQWYLNGEIAADGVKSISNTTGSTESSTIEAFYNSGGSHTFPSVDIDNVELTLAAGGGGGGGRDGGGPGGGGGGARAGKFTLINSEFVGKTIEFFTGRGGNGGSSGSCGNEYGNGANSSPSSGGGRGGRRGRPGGSSVCSSRRTSCLGLPACRSCFTTLRRCACGRGSSSWLTCHSSCGAHRSSTLGGRVPIECGRSLTTTGRAPRTLVSLACTVTSTSTASSSTWSRATPTAPSSSSACTGGARGSAASSTGRGGCSPPPPSSGCRSCAR